MLIVAKLSTVVVGLLVLLGGLFIKDFGGAFEANKLFTGIFAIPIGIPLVLGIISRKPSPRGALLTVILGAIAGIILNSFPSVFSWEMATLTETVFCLAVFYGSGLQKFKNREYLERVNQLFKRLHRKIERVPDIDASFKRALSILYITSLVVAGILFIGMGLPALEELSGVLSLISGITCLIIGAVMWTSSKKSIKKSIKK